MVANLKHFIRKFIAKLVIEFATNLQVCKFIANLFFGIPNKVTITCNFFTCNEVTYNTGPGLCPTKPGTCGYKETVTAYPYKNFT